MPLYAPERYTDPADEAAQQDAAARKRRTGSENPTFDPAAPTPATYSADATKPTALNPLGQNPNTGAGNYLTAPTNVPGASIDVPKPTPSAGTGTVTPPPTLAPPVSRPSFGDVSNTLTSRPVATALGGDPTAISGAPRAVVNGREISQDEINRLARTNVISSEGFRNPGIGTLGVPVSSAQGIQMAAQNIPRPTPTYDADAALQDAQMGAKSDIGSILTEDPRSALGIAARNARITLGDIKNPRSRYGQARATPYQEALGAMLQQAGQGVQEARAVAQQRSQEANQQALEGTRQVGDNQRAALNAETQRFDAWMRRPTPTQIKQADGTLGLLGQDGTVRPALDPTGQRVSEFIGKPPEEIASLNKMVNERANTLLGIDPLSGMITDANGQKRRPTASEMQQADAAARETFTGGRPMPAAPAGKPTLDQFLAAARAAPQNKGRSDDELRAFYKSNYGT